MTDKDKQAILRTGIDLNYATVDGVTIVTNGHLILPMQPFLNASETEVVTPEAIEKYWRGLPERLAKARAVAIFDHCKFGDQFVTRLTNSSTVNTGYLYVFDGCKIFASGEYDPVIFVRDGAIAGAIMPMRNLTQLEPCDAPTLEDLLASIRKLGCEEIRKLEEEIADARSQIAELETAIRTAEGEIVKIRSRNAEVVR